MSDETKNNQALADMELDDNFFDINAKAEEEAFLSEFEQPINFNASTVGIEKNTNTETIEEDDKNKVEESFKFDDALAEEEAKELAELNAKMGTDFKSRNELNEALKQIDKKEDNNEINEEKKYIAYFSDLLNVQKYPDDVLVREDKLIAASNAGKNLKDPDVIESIDYEVQQLTDSGALPYAANSIRDTLKRSLNEKQKYVKDFEESQQLTVKQQQDKFKQDLQEGISEVFKQGTFLGVKPTKQDMLDIYRDISKNKHLEHLKAHPKDAVEFALFKKFQEVIKKNLGKPNYEAGVKNTLQELGMSNSSQTGTNGKDIASDNNAGDLTFLQRFAK